MANGRFSWQDEYGHSPLSQLGPLEAKHAIKTVYNMKYHVQLRAHS